MPTTPQPSLVMREADAPHNNYGVAIPYNSTRSESIFSGNAVVDVQNLTALCDTNDTIMAYYASVFKKDAVLPDGFRASKGTQVISWAYSCDNGFHFTEYEYNPVIREPPKPYTDQWRNMRDPNVFWHRPTRRWFMILVLAEIKKAVWFTTENLISMRDPNVFWHRSARRWFMILVLAEIKKAVWFTTENLIHWEAKNEFSWRYTPEGSLECPSLSEFEVENTGEHKWLLLLSTNLGGLYGGSGMHYHVGDFKNGSDFEKYNPNSTTVEWVDYGSDCYAGILWNRIEKRIMTFWLNNWRYSTTIGDVYKVR